MTPSEKEITRLRKILIDAGVATQEELEQLKGFKYLKKRAKQVERYWQSDSKPVKPQPKGRAELVARQKKARPKPEKYNVDSN